MSDEEDFYDYDEDELQEIDVEDEYEEPDSPVIKKKEEYVILSLHDVVKRQQEEVETITEVLGVSNASARVLLRKFG
jgi:leucyl-tRNA synthetase